MKLELQSSLYIDTKIPKEMENSDFLNVLKEKLKENVLKEKLKDYNNRIIGYSQESIGTFTIKDNKVTDIHLTDLCLYLYLKMEKKNDRKQANQ